MTVKDLQVTIARHIAITMLSLAAGCGGIDADQPRHCYLVAGLYLVVGDEFEAIDRAYEVWGQWADYGCVKDVFEAYNDDPALTLRYWQDITIDEIAEHLDAGRRVVIQYWLAGGYQHTEAIIDVAECDGLDITWVYVAGYFEGIQND